MAHIEKLKPEFTEGFPGGITMTLKRLDSWQFAAVRSRAARHAASLREGATLIDQYGLDEDEFAALADPDTWAGLTELIYAVELGLMAIQSWTGVQRQGEKAVLPVERAVLARLMRLGPVRGHFLDIMQKEGERYRLVPEEGNG